LRIIGGRKPKKLWTDKEEGDKIQYHRADDDKEEARFIAIEIERLRSKGRKYSDLRYYTVLMPNPGILKKPLLEGAYPIGF